MRIILRNTADKLQGLRYALPFSSWWLDLKSWWMTRETDYFPVFLLAGLALVGSAISFAIMHSMETEVDNRQLTCLALNIYHEARGEPKAGQYAVAEVTLNRVKSKHYPNTICEVVHQKGWDKKRKRYVSHFSWTQRDYAINTRSKQWLEATKIAQKVYDGDIKPRVKGALFYHANYVKPRWARKKKVKAKIGKHIFY